jgi:four helix bundle protein
MNVSDKKYNPNLRENLIVNLTFQFTLDIVKFVETLEGSRTFAVANQLIKSGTSVGANVREAQSAESKADFIHKLKIAAKEADETEYWLLICDQSENYPSLQRIIRSNPEYQKSALENYCIF